MMMKILSIVLLFVGFISCNSDSGNKNVSENSVDKTSNETVGFINLMAIPNKEKVGLNKLFTTTVVLLDEPKGKIEFESNLEVDSIRMFSDTIVIYNTPQTKMDNKISVTILDKVEGKVVNKQMVEMSYVVVNTEVRLTSIDNKPFKIYEENQLKISVDSDEFVRLQLSVTGGSVVERNGDWFLTPASLDGVTVTVTGVKQGGQKTHLETFGILVE